MKKTRITTTLMLLVLLAAPASAAEKGSLKRGKEPAKNAVAVPEKAPAPAANVIAKKVNAPPKNNRPTALESRLVLKVTNPREAKKAIQAEAEKRGGYLSYVDNQQLIVKLPPEVLQEMMKRTGELGDVIEKTFGREDLTMEIAEIRGRLKSKQEILKKTREFFDDSDAIATLEIEKTMTGLVTEMERLKGRLRVLTDRSSWALLEISFVFRERDRILYLESEFDWLNTADLDRFLEDF